MKPMQPMEPMKPMKPMEPMKPMVGGEAWWPRDLGAPSSSGSQNGWRYAFFSSGRRLLVDQDGKVTTYDTGEHAINGVSQSSGSNPSFSTNHGAVNLNELKQVS